MYALSIHNGSETTTYRRDLMGRSLGETSSLGASSFSYDLWFDKTPSEVTPRLDGRLSAMTWYDGSATQAGYSYTYNNYGELTKGTFITGANTTSPWSINAKFEEQAAYNRAGNITSITRTNAAAGSSTLTMTYSGYKLSTVKVGTSAASAAFSYDNAGNITKDAATGVSFTYHQGRLPNKIFAGTDQITYIYNADGQKISSTAAGSSTYYHGPMIYTRTGTGAYILSSILFEGGMILHSGGTYTYQYNKTDHTGSTRAVLQATGTNTLKRVQRTDYYPFGLAHEYGNTNLNRYLYSGKELMTDKMASAAAFDYPGKGLLGLYDFGSRFYNPLYGRWLNTDPAWQFANPYLYCGNNPVMFTDPNGEVVWFIPIIIAAAKAAAAAAIAQTVVAAYTPDGFDNWNWQRFGTSVAASFIGGAVSGMVGAGMGAASTAGGAMANGALSGAAGGAAGASAYTWMNGGSLGDGIKSGVKGAVLGGVIGGITGLHAHDVKQANFYPDANQSSFETSNQFSDGSYSDVNYVEGRYFRNPTKGYRYLWEKSFKVNGKWNSEMNGWKLKKGGFIVDRNTGNTKVSANRRYGFINGKMCAQHNGKWYQVDASVHSHPNIQGPSNNPLGISNADIDAYLIDSSHGVTSQIIYGGDVYNYSGNSYLVSGGGVTYIKYWAPTGLSVK